MIANHLSKLKKTIEEEKGSEIAENFPNEQTVFVIGPNTLVCRFCKLLSLCSYAI